MRKNRAGPRRRKESRRPDRETILLAAAILNLIAAIANLVRELLKR